MKKALLAIISLCALAFTGCNSVGDKDTMIARVNGEPIFKEDYALLMRVGNVLPHTEQMRKASGALFSRKAIYTEALRKFPELKERLAQRYDFIDDYLLTFVFQRLYANDRLMYSDDELSFYYDKHRDQFPDKLSYMSIRDKVAEAKYLESHESELKAFAAKHPSADSSEGIKITDNIKELFLQDLRQRMARELGPSLLKKYNIQETEIKMPSVEEYYEKHKDFYRTEYGYIVYHVEGSDSAKLASHFKNKDVDLPTFMKIASKYSENKFTKTTKGFVGKVILGNPFPYGIGFVPDMYVEFGNTPEKKVSSVLRSQSTGRFHVFYQAAFVKSEVKPLERVRAAVKYDLEHAPYELDSSYVLVTKNGEPAIREKDVLAAYRENPTGRRSRKMHQQIVSFLAMQLAFATEARELGLDRSWEYRAMRRQNEVDFVIKNFKPLINKMVMVPEDSLKALYERMGNPLFPNMSYEFSRADLSDWFVIPENLMKRRYYYRQEDFLPATFEEARRSVFEEAALIYRNCRWDKEIVSAWGQAKVELFTDNVTLLPQEWSVEVAMKAADSLYSQARDLNKSYLAWTGIRDRYVDIDSVARKATFEIAHILSDREQYDEAQREYKSYYRTWPDSPDSEKAMFSRGFILNENMHRDSLALEVFNEFKKTYPKSDLSESVDWLIQNIKSNGKLAEDLMKKIEASEQK